MIPVFVARVQARADFTYEQSFHDRQLETTTHNGFQHLHVAIVEFHDLNSAAHQVFLHWLIRSSSVFRKARSEMSACLADVAGFTKFYTPRHF